MRWHAMVLPLLLAAPPVPAQVPHEREGFWWAFGIGYGAYYHTCERCSRPSGRAGVGSGHLTFGAAVGRRATVGVELQSGALRDDAGQTSISLVALCYPWASRGVFLRVGTGTSSYRQRAYEDIYYRGSGLGWLAAVGWDVRVDRKLSLTPMVTYRAGAPGTVVALVFDTAATNLRQRSVTFTIGLTFH